MDTSNVTLPTEAVKSSRKWKMPKKKCRIGRYVGNGSDRKSTNGRRPTSPLQPLMESTTIITPSPRARKSKRKISKAQLEIELSLTSKKNKLAEDELQKERAKRVILMKQKDRLLRQHSKDKTTMGVLGGLLIESRKTGRKYAAELK